MASFLAKISEERLRKREYKKKIVQMSSYLARNKKFQKNSKKILKKLKDTIMASFQAKIGWESLRKIEKKKNRSDEFLPDPEQGNPKKLQKNSKN